MDVDRDHLRCIDEILQKQQRQHNNVDGVVSNDAVGGLVSLCMCLYLCLSQFVYLLSRTKNAIIIHWLV